MFRELVKVIYAEIIYQQLRARPGSVPVSRRWVWENPAVWGSFISIVR